MSTPAPRGGDAFVRAAFGVDPRGLVLASRSPRRRDLLSQIGIVFEVDVPDVDETHVSGEGSLAHVERLARAKAACVAARRGERLVVAADTVVVNAGEILGKPKDAGEARAMLRALSARTHVVATGVAVQLGGTVHAGSEETAVSFREIDPREIDAYVATEEPMDKAGSYGVQGLGAVFVSRVEGCYYNVVGLPLARLVTLVRRFAT